jgi:1-acyl-sn-glycerol-3-phosphate acyltransferase
MFLLPFPRRPPAIGVVVSRTSQRRRNGLTYRAIVAVVWPTLMTVTRRTWRGAEHLPAEGGFIVCCNHMTVADPLTVGHFLNDHNAPPRYLAKASLFRIPVIGRMLGSAGQIPVERGTVDAASALQAAVKALDEGSCVVVYPEGTLTRDPDLWPMVGKTGAARLALMTGRPVIPIAHWGSQNLLARYGKVLRFWRRPRVWVSAGPPIDLSAYAGRAGETAALRAATEDILDRITELLAEIRQEPAPAQRWDPRVQGRSR